MTQGRAWGSTDFEATNARQIFREAFTYRCVMKSLKVEYISD